MYRHDNAIEFLRKLRKSQKKYCISILEFLSFTNIKRKCENLGCRIEYRSNRGANQIKSHDNVTYYKIYRYWLIPRNY